MAKAEHKARMTLVGALATTLVSSIYALVLAIVDLAQAGRAVFAEGNQTANAFVRYSFIAH